MHTLHTQSDMLQNCNNSAKSCSDKNTFLNCASQLKLLQSGFPTFMWRFVTKLRLLSLCFLLLCILDVLFRFKAKSHSWQLYILGSAGRLLILGVPNVEAKRGKIEANLRLWQHRTTLCCVGLGWVWQHCSNRSCCYILVHCAHIVPHIVTIHCDVT